MLLLYTYLGVRESAKQLLDILQMKETEGAEAWGSPDFLRIIKQGWSK